MAGRLAKGARITGAQRGVLAGDFLQRYRGGESIRAIAEESGRSYGFVHGVLVEAGAELRGRGGATRGPRRTPAAPDTTTSVGAAGRKAKPGKKSEPKKAAPAKSVAKKKDAKKDKAKSKGKKSGARKD